MLVPGGRALVTSWASIERSPLMLARIAAMRAADPLVPSPQQNVMTLEDPAVFAREMREAGFVDVSIEPVFREWEFHDLDELCSTGLTRGSAPLEILRRQLGLPDGSLSPGPEETKERQEDPAPGRAAAENCAGLRRAGEGMKKTADIGRSIAA